MTKVTPQEHLSELGMIGQHWHIDPHDDHTVMELTNRDTRQVATIYGPDRAARRNRTLVVAAAPAAYRGMCQLRNLADRVRNGEIDPEDAVKVMLEIDQRTGLEF